jgi:uncharacterized protein
MKTIHSAAWLLLIVGGLNWLLVALFNWDISQWLGGPDATLTRIVYVLVGLSAIVVLFTHARDCKLCGRSSMSGGSM